MKAMLEPRMVAASTQGRDFSAHGTPGAPARITASSHGCFISNLDAYGLRTDSRSQGLGPVSEIAGGYLNPTRWLEMGD
jgi:hypothetical protein